MVNVLTIANSIKTLRYLWQLGTKEGFGNPFKGMQSPKNKPIYILANGPSLKEFIEKTESDFTPYENAEFFVVNDFVNDPHFAKIRPAYCAISDPLFFVDTIYAERGHRSMNALGEKVIWPMKLFVPIIFRHSDFLNPVKQNTNIEIVYMHRLEYSGIERFRHWFYRRGLGNGEFSTVALNALYAALLCGYKTIYFYGIDHTYFDNIAVNDNNELCYKETHFYGDDSTLKPMINHHLGMNGPVRTFTVREFLEEKLRIFTGHEILNKFANSLGAKVFNCTPNSMVDAYQRKNNC